MKLGEVSNAWWAFMLRNGSRDYFNWDRILSFLNSFVQPIIKK